MNRPFSAGERFLVAFHDHRPGVTSQSFAGLSVVGCDRVYPSPYHCLATTVHGDAVLDLACGDGHLLALLAEGGHRRLCGVDFSRGELTAASLRLGGRALLCRGRAQALPLATASADHVCSHLALMLMDDLDTVLAETARVLRPGGGFSFIVSARPPQGQPALDAYLQRLRPLLQHAPRLDGRRLADVEGIHAALAPHFRNIEVQPLTLTRRYTPDGLWQWFESMYDLALLSPLQEAALRDACLDEFAGLCDADGTVTLTETLLQATAQTA